MRKKLVTLAAVTLAATIAATPMTASASLFDNLETFSGSSPSSDTSTATRSFSTAKSATYPFSSIQAKIKERKAVNNDVVGWLTVPGTNIDEPITFNATSNDYYVYRDWKGTQYSGINYLNYVDTATYLDFRAKLGENWSTGTSKNLTLYGHNWNNLREPFKIGNQPGYTMFAQLPSYTDAAFAAQNPHIYFSTGENEGIWRVFAVAYCELSPDFYYNQANPGKDNYQKILDEWKQRTLYNFGVDVDTDDRILTLSTCTRLYGNYSEGGVGDLQRFVVVARLLRDGETENDTVTVTKNPNPKQPVFNAAAVAAAQQANNGTSSSTTEEESATESLLAVVAQEAGA